MLWSESRGDEKGGVSFRVRLHHAFTRFSRPGKKDTPPKLKLARDGTKEQADELAPTLEGLGVKERNGCRPKC